MDKLQLQQAIYDILSQKIQHRHLEEFGPDARLNEDLWLDSVLMMQLILYLELDFDISLPEQAFSAADFYQLSDFIDFVIRTTDPASPAKVEQQSAPNEWDLGAGVHGDEYEDIKVHCFISCVCDALKNQGLDHRPFYFGLWDGEFALDEAHAIRYHHSSIDHQYYRDWFTRLYGVDMTSWYDPSLSKADNIHLLEGFLGTRQPDEYLMVMLDMFHLPERENKFNQNPFPHYVLLEETDNPDYWRVSDPDYRWEGELCKSRVKHAISQPTVEGGWRFDSAQAHAAKASDIADYFVAGFYPHVNPLTEAIRTLLEQHIQGHQGLSLAHLKDAVAELPVISVRKWAYEHGLAFFWRVLKLPALEFEHCCEQVAALIQGFKRLHYLLLKLSETADTGYLPDLTSQLNKLDKMEFEIKNTLEVLYLQYCHELNIRPLRFKTTQLKEAL